MLKCKQPLTNWFSWSPKCQSLSWGPSLHHCQTSISLLQLGFSLYHLCSTKTVLAKVTKSKEHFSSLASLVLSYFMTLLSTPFLKKLSCLRRRAGPCTRVWWLRSWKDILAIKVSLEEHRVSTPCWDPPTQSTRAGKWSGAYIASDSENQQDSVCLEEERVC